MVHQRGGHGDLIVCQHSARLVELVHMNACFERRPAFLTDACLDVDGIHLYKCIHHPGDAGWAVEMHCRVQATGPGQPHHVEQIGVVVRVVMGQEDIAQHRQADAGLGQLLRHAVAAIDEIRLPVDH